MLLFRCQVMSDSCDPMDCSPPGSSVRGIIQARILNCGLPLPPPGDLPHPRIKPGYPMSSPLQADSLHIEPLGSCPVFPTPCFPEDVFPHYISCLLSGGLRPHRSASSFLGSLFYSIDPCVCWWSIPGFFLSSPHQVSHADPDASGDTPPVAVAQGNSSSVLLLQVLPSPPVPKTTQGFIGWRSGVPGLNKCLEHDYEIRSCKGAYAKELNWPKQGIH